MIGENFTKCVTEDMRREGRSGSCYDSTSTYPANLSGKKFSESDSNLKFSEALEDTEVVGSVARKLPTIKEDGISMITEK